MDNSAAAPRRSSMACTNCRYRKVKCASSQPGARCHRCIKHNYDCQYRSVAEEEATNSRALTHPSITQATWNPSISSPGSGVIPLDETPNFVSTQRTADISVPFERGFWDTPIPLNPPLYHDNLANHGHMGTGGLDSWTSSAVSHRLNIRQPHHSQLHDARQYTTPFQQPPPGVWPDPERLSLTPEANSATGDTTRNQYYLPNPSLQAYYTPHPNENNYPETRVACSCHDQLGCPLCQGI